MRNKKMILNFLLDLNYKNNHKDKIINIININKNIKDTRINLVYKEIKDNRIIKVYLV